ncbi:6-bladed beta-propeller [Mucilaginibacter antarcticus]|uniref:6-bladed beta-propeller n=1 Tax=Mucilaginibacter antarcticus TaxID=1855725 RepID=A0ABW5XSM5_9SPHI
MKYLALLLPVVFFVSCSKTDAGKVSKITVNLLDTPTVFIEDVAQDVVNVNLGPPGDTTMKYPTHFFVSDNEIIVVDKFQSAIYTFDKKGVLKHKIKSVAKREDSFQQITDVLFDEATNTIEVLDLSASKIFTYKPDGHFVKKLNIVDPIHFGLSFAKAGNVYASLARRSNNPKQSNSISVFKQTDDMVSYATPAVPAIPLVKTLDIAFSHQFENHKGSLYYFPLLDDKIYEIGLDKSTPAYQINVGDEHKLTKQIREEPPVKDHFQYWKKVADYKLLCDNSSLFITDNWVSFNYRYGPKNRFCNVFYSKKTGKTIQVSEFKSRKDTAFTSKYNILAKHGDYFVAASPTFKRLDFGNPLIIPVAHGKQPQYETTFRLTFFKLKAM